LAIFHVEETKNAWKRCVYVWGGLRPKRFAKPRAHLPQKILFLTKLQEKRGLEIQTITAGEKVFCCGVGHSVTMWLSDTSLQDEKLELLSELHIIF